MPSPCFHRPHPFLCRFVRVHVTGKFRLLFGTMRCELLPTVCSRLLTPLSVHVQRLGLVNPNNPCDLFYLHAVFLPIVQHHLNNFRGMWNEHRIRGKRTVQGHGGGIPSELFNDPIKSRIVLNDDKDYAQQVGCFPVCVTSPRSDSLRSIAECASASLHWAGGPARF